MINSSFYPIHYKLSATADFWDCKAAPTGMSTTSNDFLAPPHGPGGHVINISLELLFGNKTPLQAFYQPRLTNWWLWPCYQPRITFIWHTSFFAQPTYVCVLLHARSLACSCTCAQHTICSTRSCMISLDFVFSSFCVFCTHQNHIHIR